MSKKQLTFSKYSCYSLKARVLWAQKVLQSLGYDKVILNGKREKAYIKAMIDFQKSHNLGSNAMVCEKTFNELYNAGGKDISIDL